MKILSAQEIKKLDRYTIENEPISSINLMERAANAFCDKFLELIPQDIRFVEIFCGLGNNGGDGLAIGRLLVNLGYQAKIYIIDNGSKKSADFLENFERIGDKNLVNAIVKLDDFPSIHSGSVIIDAIFGIGLNRPAEGLEAAIIGEINKSQNLIFAVDIPSGLYSDKINDKKDAIIFADFTISFQVPKLAFFISENAGYLGEWYLVPIGLNNNYLENLDTNYFYTNKVAHLIKKRTKWAHKGNFGHGLLITGSYGMMGAAQLAAKACLRTGIGKLTVLVPKCGYEIMQIAVPEAMAKVDNCENNITENIDYTPYSAIGVGPGLGKSTTSVAFLKEFLQNNDLPKILDADALNIIAEHQLKNFLSPNTIITPHPKEFERLIGKIWQNDFQKLDWARDFAKQYELIVVLKGAHTAVVLPDGQIHFNSTGNAGMAKAGSGDVLTGMITSLLAQSYSPENAAIIAVYLHGKAGDIAADTKGQNAMIASDIIEAISF